MLLPAEAAASSDCFPPMCAKRIDSSRFADRARFYFQKQS
jgi:hypothetical protein